MLIFRALVASFLLRFQRRRSSSSRPSRLSSSGAKRRPQVLESIWTPNNNNNASFGAKKNRRQMQQAPVFRTNALSDWEARLGGGRSSDLSSNSSNSPPPIDRRPLKTAIERFLRCFNQGYIKSRTLRTVI